MPDQGPPGRIAGAVLDSRQLLESLFSQSPIAISLNREDDGVYTDVNEEWTRLTGLRAEQALGRTTIEVGFWDSAEQRRSRLGFPLKDGERIHVDLRLVRQDGKALILDVSMSRLVIDGTAYLLSYLKDVTDERSVQADLQASQQRIKAANDLLQKQVRLFEALEELASVGYWTSSTQLAGSLRWSNGLYRVAGLVPGSVEDASTGRGRIHPDDLARFVQARGRADSSLLEYRWLHPDGRERWLRTRIQPLTTENGESIDFGVVQDITTERAATDALQEKLRFVEQITAHLPGVVFQFRRRPDGFQEFLYISEPVRELYRGITPEQILQDANCTMHLHHPADLPAFVHSLDESAKKLTPWTCEYRLRFDDGVVRWLMGHAIPQLQADGSVLWNGVTTDITERKAAEAHIERLAFYDVLTHLPNRRLLIDRLQHALMGSARDGTVGALLFIDLDNFKDLNDTHGHAVGDQLLMQVAERLSGCVRSIDTIARLGGDEFVVMLSHLGTDVRVAAVQAEAIGRKILATLNQRYDMETGTHHSTPSIGITLFHDHNLGTDELLKRADVAMYQAKAAGRNTLRFYDPAMQALAAARSTLEADLRLAMERQEFSLHFQPIVNRQGAVLGTEALLRWQHPARGMVYPGEFIELAEQNGLIVPLGQWVLQSACAQLCQWAGNSITAAWTLSVNVSARQFRQPDFASQLLDMLQASSADPSRLKIEITESLLLHDTQDVTLKMEQLQAVGVSFSLDDFGTGYSSLAYLRKLPLEQLKIDKSFVRDLLDNPNDAAIVQTVLALGRSLGLTVVAEGVETAEQRDALAQQGCQMFQGYFFGKPMPASQLVALACAISG